MPDLYAKFKLPPQPVQLEQIAKLANEQALAEIEVAKCELALKKAEERLTDIAERQLPEAMDAAGMKTFQTTSGLKVDIAGTMYASVPKDKADQAMQWLEDNNHGGLIKREVVAGFNRGEGDNAQKVLDFAKTLTTMAKSSRFVESSSLRAFLAEELREGREVPLEMFGAHFQTRAKITVIE